MVPLILFRQDNAITSSRELVYPYEEAYLCKTCMQTRRATQTDSGPLPGDHIPSTYDSNIVCMGRIIKCCDVWV